MPKCRRCNNEELFYASRLSKLRTLIRIIGENFQIQEQATVVLGHFEPYQIDTCAKCKSTDLDWPEVDVPF